MSQLEVVNDHDEVIGLEDYEAVHAKGLRHRSVQVLVFGEHKLNNLLVARRAQKQAVSKGLLHPSAAGHVRPGQAYKTAALAELQEELFHERELPSGLTVVEIASYQNDTRPTNKENTRLFYAIHNGPFFPDPQETDQVDFKNRTEIWQDMQGNPDRYTTSFKTAMGVLRASVRDTENIHIPYILNNEEFERSITTYDKEHAEEPIPLWFVQDAIFSQNQFKDRCVLLAGPTSALMVGTAKRILTRLGYQLTRDGQGYIRTSTQTIS